MAATNILHLTDKQLETLTSALEITARNHAECAEIEENGKGRFKLHDQANHLEYQAATLHLLADIEDRSSLIWTGKEK